MALTFIVEQHGSEIIIFTQDLKTGETHRIGTLDNNKAVVSFYDVINGGLLVAREQGRSGL